MPSIQRRTFLGTLATASALAGCASVPGSSAPSSDSPTATAQPTQTDRIQIVVENEDAKPTTVDLHLTDGDRTLLDRQVNVPGGRREAVDTGIDDTGEYDLGAFVVGGPDLAFEFTVPVEESDLRQGSNVVLLADGEHLEKGKEE